MKWSERDSPRGWHIRKSCNDFKKENSSRGNDKEVPEVVEMWHDRGTGHMEWTRVR